MLTNYLSSVETREWFWKWSWQVYRPVNNDEATNKTYKDHDNRAEMCLLCHIAYTDNNSIHRVVDGKSLWHLIVGLNKPTIYTCISDKGQFIIFKGLFTTFEAYFYTFIAHVLKLPNAPYKHVYSNAYKHTSQQPVYCSWATISREKLISTPNWPAVITVICYVHMYTERAQNKGLSQVIFWPTSVHTS